MTTAVAVRKEEPLVLSQAVGTPKQLRRVISEQWKNIASVVPEHFNEERFGALVIAAAHKSPELFKCSGISILNAMHQAASLGLEINAATGEAYLIPYKQNAQLVPGYKGLVKLAIQSRSVQSIEARLVYEGEQDTFDVRYGTDSGISHKPNFEVERNPQTVVAAYGVAKMPSGGVTFEVMTRRQLNAIRARSAAVKSGKSDSPWFTDEEEMMRKTVTRRLCKYLPMSPQLAQAVELSDRHETGEYENTPVVQSEGTRDLNHALGVPCEACGGTNENHTDACPYNEQGA